MRKPPAYAAPGEDWDYYQVPIKDDTTKRYFLLEGMLDTLDRLQRAMRIEGLDIQLEETRVPKSSTNDEIPPTVSVCEVDTYSWTVLNRQMKMMECRQVETDILVDGKKTIAISFLYPELWDQVQQNLMN